MTMIDPASLLRPRTGELDPDATYLASYTHPTKGTTSTAEVKLDQPLGEVLADGVVRVRVRRTPGTYTAFAYHGASTYPGSQLLVLASDLHDGTAEFAEYLDAVTADDSSLRDLGVALRDLLGCDGYTVDSKATLSLNLAQAEHLATLLGVTVAVES